MKFILSLIIKRFSQLRLIPLFLIVVLALALGEQGRRSYFMVGNWSNEDGTTVVKFNRNGTAEWNFQGIGDGTIYGHYRIKYIFWDLQEWDYCIIGGEKVPYPPPEAMIGSEKIKWQDDLFINLHGDRMMMTQFDNSDGSISSLELKRIKD